MKQPLLLFITICCVFSGFAQQGDFIVIKKRNNRTVTSFFSGAQVSFQTNTGEWYNGRVADIRNDSLFFRQQLVRQVPTPWGVPRLDTMTTSMRSIHFKNIYAIPRRHESFSYVKNGTLLIMGGAGYILLNVINSAYLHYAVFGKNNLPGLLTASAVLATGITLKKLHRNYLVMGKRYSVEYVKM